MSLVVYSQSHSFNEHISEVAGTDASFRTSLSPAIANVGNIYLVHAASFEKGLEHWLEESCRKGAYIAVTSELPSVEQMIKLTQMGVRAYCNSYMSASNYAQLLRLLASGQSWFPPPLVNQAFELASKALQKPVQANPLEQLTNREKQVALAVAQGQSNKAIAEHCNMAERTVKTHLTHIFKKLKVKDRIALVIYLKQFD